MSQIPEELELPNVLGDVIAAQLSEVNAAVICKVQSFDRPTQTAVVVPQVRRNGEALPAIPTVPVVFPVAYSDLQADTFGILLCARDNWRRWWRTGDLSDPEDASAHGLTNGVFLPCITPQGDPRSLGPDSTVLLRPTVGGTVHLGTWNASKDVVHEDLLTALRTFLLALDTWGTAIGAGWVPAVQTPLQAMTAAILAGTYQSPSVKVEN